MLRPGLPFAASSISGAGGIEHERAEVEKQRKALTEWPWRGLDYRRLGYQLSSEPLLANRPPCSPEGPGPA